MTASARGATPTADEKHSFIVVSNRLPIDRVIDDEGNAEWQHSPGGLVTALEPVMRQRSGAWVGWVGQPDFSPEPFDSDGIRRSTTTSSRRPPTTASGGRPTSR
jgi:trehalose 6-phosphate synthase